MCMCLKCVLDRLPGRASRFQAEQLLGQPASLIRDIYDKVLWDRGDHGFLAAESDITPIDNPRQARSPLEDAVARPPL
jgi:hypothetical protein